MGGPHNDLKRTAQRRSTVCLSLESSGVPASLVINNYWAHCVGAFKAPPPLELKRLVPTAEVVCDVTLFSFRWPIKY